MYASHNSLWYQLKSLSQVKKMKTAFPNAPGNAFQTSFIFEATDGN